MGYQDLLSDLPLGIIHDILGRLPIRVAVRTSILSRQWRYTWTTLRNLVFDNDVFDDDSWPEDLEEDTNIVINSVLSVHKGPIHRFEMSFSLHFRIQLLEKWLLFLAKNGIRELFIIIDCEEDDDTHLLESSIYSCTKLTNLVLWNFTLKPPPSTFKGFLFLTSLCLERVCSQGVEVLVANSPLLETLTITNLESSRPVTINAPNLKNLDLHCDHITELRLYAPLLGVMYMNLEESDFPLDPQSLDSNYVKFFSDLTHLVQLNGGGYFTRYMSIGIEFCSYTLVLHYLKVIQLSGVNFADIEEMSVVSHLIIGAPNLHTLQISARIEGDVSNKDFGFAPSFTLKKLKVVYMFGICDYLFGRQFIKFLLERSPVLETLNLGRINEEVSAELLGFCRASPNARILVNQ